MHVMTRLDKFCDFFPLLEAAVVLHIGSLFKKSFVLVDVHVQIDIRTLLPFIHMYVPILDKLPS